MNSPVSRFGAPALAAMMLISAATASTQGAEAQPVVSVFPSPGNAAISDTSPSPRLEAVRMPADLFESMCDTQPVLLPTGVLISYLRGSLQSPCGTDGGNVTLVARSETGAVKWRWTTPSQQGVDGQPSWDGGGLALVYGGNVGTSWQLAQVSPSGAVTRRAPVPATYADEEPLVYSSDDGPVLYWPSPSNEPMLGLWARGGFSWKVVPKFLDYNEVASNGSVLLLGGDQGDLFNGPPFSDMLLAVSLSDGLPLWTQDITEAFPVRGTIDTGTYIIEYGWVGPYTTVHPPQPVGVAVESAATGALLWTKSIPYATVDTGYGYDANLVENGTDLFWCHSGWGVGQGIRSVPTCAAFSLATGKRVETFPVSILGSRVILDPLAASPHDLLLGALTSPWTCSPDQAGVPANPIGRCTPRTSRVLLVPLADPAAARDLGVPGLKQVTFNSGAEPVTYVSRFHALVW